MDFKDKLKQLAEKIDKLKASTETEEATKIAFVMPFLHMLGYDVFDPTEVIPEMTCDIGTKKGEKIDYCIAKDGEPIILIECKHWAQNLNLHDNQLLRYFHVSKAKFGVLTNGIVYRFYSDLSTPNKMDETPFLEVDLSKLRDSHIEELKKFHKSYFDIDSILSSASELKYMSELKKIIAGEFSSPSQELVKLLGKQVYDGQFTAKAVEQFSALVKRAISEHISEVISTRLNTAISLESASSESKDEDVSTPVDESGIVTTEEELEGYRIVRAILAPYVDPARIYYRDAQSYFTIILDDNRLKNICRLYLNSETNKSLAFLQDGGGQVKHKIENIVDLYKHSELLVESLKRFLEE